MSLPRDVSGADRVKALARFGYQVTRQKGSHVRPTARMGGEHHVTIPLHRPLRIGTLAAILADVARHFGIGRDDVRRRLFE